ncbi:unnamed protein product [Nippostrongylus brasiliensis]|uniref:SEA domain-containing protein n=1 Tax=Nippostrongylus brasiliensis TaxID=27835 RepID=A0A0N4Y687_NIPBR|nr:unnamed protein product [Nippostrongylus brasiliensis]
MLKDSSVSATNSTDYTNNNPSSIFGTRESSAESPISSHTDARDYGALVIRVAAGVVIFISLSLILLVVGNMIYTALTDRVQLRERFVEQCYLLKKELRSEPSGMAAFQNVPSLASSDVRIEVFTDSLEIERTIQMYVQLVVTTYFRARIVGGLPV